MIKKILFLFIALNFPHFSLAQDIIAPATLAQKSDSSEIILIQSAGASPVDFLETAKNTKGLITYMEYQIQKLQSAPRQEERLFALGEHLDQDADSLIQDVSTITKEMPLTSTSLNFLKDFSEKIQSRPLKPVQIQFFSDLICKTASLTEELHRGGCKTIRVDLGSLHRQWPLVESLVIESKKFAANGDSPEVSAQSSYHWSLLSNTHKVIAFYGTYEQLMQQYFVFENLVDGDCQGFTNRVDEFEVSSRALIFFSKACTRPVIQPVQKAPIARWFERNKGWIYPLGGALILGGALLATQGSTLVIDKP